ncbi:MAG: 50S ribosomal protein L18 [Candidatus Marinamargulisbacteria bacterium]|jgi:large subunit ribosomal protein L18
MTNKRYILKVKKSSHHVYALLLDDINNILASSSTLSLKFKQANVENCFKVGQDIGKKVKDMKISSVRFDRNGIVYHGKIKSLADGARDAGLEF